MIKAFDINHQSIASQAGVNAVKRLKHTKTVKKLEHSMPEIQLNATMKPNPFSSAIQSKRMPSRIKRMKVDPLCLPIFNDSKECLFQADSHIWNCKQQINEYLFCQQKPNDYIEFLKMSTPQQRLPKKYDFVLNEARYDWN